MKIYHQFGNQDVEIISDSYKFEYPPEYENAVIEVQSRMVLPKGVEVDIGCGNAFGGKNEEEPGEEGAGNEAPPMKVNDLIDAFKYEQSALGKQDIKDYFKAYFQKMTGGEKPIIPADRQPAYKKGCTAFVKRLLTKFDDFTIYTPSDYSMEGPLIFSTYKDEADEAPAFYFILEGLPSFKA